ncbi:hypothetical protein AvCA_08260 [Azotobacter vinelandii CA]|uniref:Uncharacterized protein n=2 Tax=Azotobacter vinelandii TaxID=354 RepID=C1DMP1_AZOVD|nr:hypothetical protein Avin_08260 [Azotobacter vinelandii DJ]AGK17174.1 hypothetical protein AvCA_08260 [Azotobacter vinelandii CA]AGK19546.1 hypothetical protein AvCA6_08260 [Azotobacter vinelandii CA6]
MHYLRSGRKAGKPDDISDLCIIGPDR